ncbi:MAG: hypothetical protein FWG89_00695 [Treponema sp.]|nr:hypothetical protein [Treponema sp.]
MQSDEFTEAVTYGEYQAAFRLDDADAEPQTREALKTWYEKQWNEARVLARENALWDDGERTEANAESVDPELLDDAGSIEFNPELYEEEAHELTDNISGDERAGPDRPDTGVDQAAPGHSWIDRDDPVQRGSGDGVAGRAEDAGGREGRGDSRTQDRVKDGPITTSEANRRLAAKLPRVVDGFVLGIGRTIRMSLKHFEAQTAEDAAEREQIGRDQRRIDREIHPYIRALARTGLMLCLWGF